ncbi:hypothetical protein D3C81_1952930 [compost metagenome]
MISALSCNARKIDPQARCALAASICFFCPLISEIAAGLVKPFTCTTYTPVLPSIALEGLFGCSPKTVPTTLFSNATPGITGFAKTTFST